MIPSIARGRIHYGWIVVAVTFLTMLAAAGIRSVPGVLILPLEGEFGWDRATISLAVSINMILYGLCSPFAATLVERLGMRRIMASALLIVAVAVGATTRMTAAWQLVVLWGAVAGVGVGTLAGWVAATVSNRWFVERRGLVVGVLTAAGATGQLVFLPLLAWVIEASGWRAAALIVTAVALVMVPLVLLLIRDSPEAVGIRPYGAPVDWSPPRERAIATGNSFTAALGMLWSCLRHRDFLLLAGSFFVCGASTNGLIGTHLIPASIEHGMPEVTAAGFLAVIGAFDIVGTVLSGWLSDRVDSRWLLAWYYGLRGLSLMFLPYALEAGVVPLGVFVVFYGLDWVATVPPTVRLTSDIFGRRNAGPVYAWIFAAHQVGAAAMAYGAGAIRSALGDYGLSFVIAGFMCMIAVGMVVVIRRPSQGEPVLAAAALAPRRTEEPLNITG